LVGENDDLQQNLGTAAHLIHGTTEGRFSVTYAAGGLSPDEIQSVGYDWGDWRELTNIYRVDQIQDGWNQDKTGQQFYFIRDPGLGLWVRSDHPYRE
jgi:hypothetical protein